MKRIVFAIAIFTITFQLPVHAQSVGINNTGAAANASSILDVDVSGLANKKGLLAPRITLAQRTAMSPLPAAAQGLLVYQTDGLQGFYYNTSLTPTPNWIFVNNSGSGFRWDQLFAPTGNLSLANGANTTSFSFDGVTTGTAFSLSSNSLTSGNLLTLSSNSTAGIPTGLGLLNIARTGTNVNANVHAVGIYSTVTNTGISSENVGGLFSASGATINYGVKANIYASSGTAVYGQNSSNDAGSQFAIQGVKSGNLVANDGIGVSGTAFGTGGNNYGGAFNASGATFNTGVYGRTDGDNGNGVYGWNYSSGSGNQIGVRGKKSGNIPGTGYGVYGETSGTGINNIGGYFTASGATNNYAGIFDQGIVGIGTITPNASALLHVNIGTVSSKGLLVSGANNFSALPNLGAGSRLMFYPGKAAFRAGFIDGIQWDDANVGSYSSALGYNTMANGYSSTALGFQTRASGEGAFASGKFSIANSDYATAMGINTTAFAYAATALGSGASATGYASTAIGYNAIATNQGTVAIGSGASAYGNSAVAIGTSTDSRGLQSLALGSSTGAYADYSIAMGLGSYATGDISTATGNGTQAKGFSSVSMGVGTVAVSYASTVMGEGTKSKGYGSTVVGLNNDSLLTTTESLPSLTTPLFIVGNGNTNSTRSNAFVVQKNGKIYVDPSNINDGTLAGNALFFGQYNVTGEAIGSKRTATGNAFGLDFFTAYTNRMSIANNGNVGIGTAAPISTLHVKGSVNIFHAGVNTHTGNFWQGTSNIDGMELVSNGAGDAYIGLQRAGGAGLNLSRASGSGTLVSFYVGGAMVGSISTTGITTAFNTTSDIRLKENIIPTKSGIITLMEINVKDYNYKADINKQLQTGFLAQELYKIFPQAVTPGGEDAKTNPWTIDYSKLTPLLVKSIQEQQNEMDALKKENAEMKKQIIEILKRLKN
ncbi:MAG: tail fiber domain-containing protein [Ferruginibacter sp.]